MKTTTAVQLCSRFFSFQNLLIYVAKLDTMIESIEEIKCFGIKLINTEDFFELFLRLLINTVVVYLISNKIYLKNNSRIQFYFGYNSIALITFLMCFLLSSVKLELGFALGLFALFTIIRFRTSTVPIKEMSYLFIIIGVAVINALANKKVSYLELFFANGIVLYFVNYLESLTKNRANLKKETVSVILNNFDQLSSSGSDDIKIKLEELIGQQINSYRIKKINQVENYADISVEISSQV
jgi:hypothetical protein